MKIAWSYHLTLTQSSGAAFWVDDVLHSLRHCGRDRIGGLRRPGSGASPGARHRGETPNLAARLQGVPERCLLGVAADTRLAAQGGQQQRIVFQVVNECEQFSKRRLAVASRIEHERQERYAERYGKKGLPVPMPKPSDVKPSPSWPISGPPQQPPP
jgi:hypothetical protein